VKLQGNPENIDTVFSQEAQPQLNPKKKYLENLLTLTKTNDNCEACYNGIQIISSGGVLKSTTMKNCKIS